MLILGQGHKSVYKSERSSLVSAARLSVEAVGRLALPRPRGDGPGLSPSPCWPQRSSSVLLPLIFPHALLKQTTEAMRGSDGAKFGVIGFVSTCVWGGSKLQMRNHSASVSRPLF